MLICLLIVLFPVTKSDYRFEGPVIFSVNQSTSSWCPPQEANNFPKFQLVLSRQEFVPDREKDLALLQWSISSAEFEESPLLPSTVFHQKNNVLLPLFLREPSFYLLLSTILLFFWFARIQRSDLYYNNRTRYKV